MLKKSILGFDVCNKDYGELIDDIFDDFNENITNFIVNVNPEIIVSNYKNLNFVEYLNKQKYQIPDGIGIVLASKLKKGNIKYRITGIDLMQRICERSTECDAKIFLYGSKGNTSNVAKQKLEKLYSNINIVGTINGYVKEEEAIECINNSKANILFVGLGSPKQEEFIIKNKEKLKNIKIFMPVGGSLDVISGNLKRAPKWMIKLNLEWVYRLIQEPKRALRYFKLIKFIFLIIFNKDGGKGNEKN